MNDEKWLNILLVIAVIATIWCVLFNIDVDGEHIAEAVVTSEPIPTEVPVAVEKEVIEDKPIYIQWIPFECEEDMNDETLYPTRDEVYCLSKVVHGEASICSPEVKACVAWVVLNRVDDSSYPDTIREVVSEGKQFQGFWRESDTVPTEEEREMCYEIIKAWKNYDDRYRSIPSDYLYFMGDGNTNYFTRNYYGNLKETKEHAWNYRMPNVWKGE